MAPNQVISADSHFVEPPGMWAERIDRKFRDRAPHTEKNLKGREGEFFVCENITPIQVAGFFGSGKSSKDLPEHFKHGFDAAPIHGDLDQSLRTKTLDKFRAGELKILVASDVAF